MSVKISKRIIIYTMLCLIVLVTPDNFTKNSRLCDLWDLAKLFSYGIIGLFAVVKLIKKKYNVYLPVLMVLLYIGVLAISTLINSPSETYKFIKIYIQNLFFMLLYLYGCIDYQKAIFHSLLPALKMLVILNTLLSVLYPGGIIYSYIGLLGMKNTQLTFYVLVILLSLYDDYLNNNEKLSWNTCGLVFLMLINFAYNASSASLVVSILLCASLFIEVFSKGKLLNIRNMTIAMVAIWVAQEVIMNFINRVMPNKLKSYSVRQQIWIATINEIKKRPFLGWGVASAEEREQRMKIFFANSAHNTVLEVAYEGGLILLLIFIFVVVWNYYDICKQKSVFFNYIAILLCCFTIGTMVEVHLNIICYFPILFTVPALNRYVNQIKGNVSCD